MKFNHLLLPAAFTLSTLLAGCAGNVEPQYPPKDLKDIATSVTLDERWSTSVGDGLGRARYPLNPLLADGTLYTTSEDGLLRALDADSGETKWEVRLDTPLSSGLSSDGTRLYAGTRNGAVVAIDRTDGSIAWRSEVSSEVLATPQLNSKLIVVQSVDGTVTALNRSTGQEEWTYSSNRPSLTLRGTGTPRVIEPVTFVGFANGRLVTLDNRSGQPLWDMRVAVPRGRTEVERLVDLDGQPVLSRDGRLFVTSYNGRVMALEATSGEVIWSRDESSYLTPLRVGNYLFTVNAASHVLALDVDTGSVLWESDALEGRDLTAPTFIDGKLALGDYQGYVHLLDATSGEIVGRTELGGGGIDLPLLADGKRLYTLTNDGELAAYDIDEKSD
ncbi:Beta-barrel assembly machine subunit BamB [Chromohalobacter marismortui]|uniref:Outer membrane protein assembly factor BamB n=1 Tax=Chromohalobacter marismortui TaxID=42055 RepID=A0A4R7NFF2_9GAMM|nr:MULTISPECIES: outer membrane protein assembly factor BamB [Chromohalobacter]MCI0509382.1 outer membrane protein assembly factor BamB [Chromohalobacter sp.]MCI0593003.1 outer membrane protein assembly factor BamB [Chromohalobacter sp.]TDU19254.1 Beta-barrel assembly machine subunit BamB [Chromohalobacter marismortui]